MTENKRIILPNGKYKFHLTEIRFADESGAPLTEKFERYNGFSVTDSAEVECGYLRFSELKTGMEFVWCIPCGRGKEFFAHDPEEIAVQYFNDRFGISFVDGRSWREMAVLTMEGSYAVNGWVWRENRQYVFRGSEPKLDPVPIAVYTNGTVQAILREEKNLRLV